MDIKLCQVNGRLRAIMKASVGPVRLGCEKKFVPLLLKPPRSPEPPQQAS